MLDSEDACQAAQDITETEERAYWSQQRIDELRLRSLAFLRHVLAHETG
ncbi:hypothetical protein GGG17_14435 [Arsenicicoccus sp. MKL-02]|uniref:Uncharacterized protein n=1 Tax=Arsenicicoccus cauae TaxID=2663847 RepID=A0A6I3J182_9MICO|nr:hypothetical protein [Arsenicicoccus cauae]MTB73136.1 hypothetical protein [Arsenicicoccus cauae]